MKDPNDPTLDRRERYAALNASKGLCAKCPRKAKRKRNGKLARLCATHLRRDAKAKRKAKEAK